MHEHANAARQRTRNCHLVAAQQRHIEPAQLSGRECGELSVQVGSRRENCARDVATINVVATDHERKKLSSRGQYFFPRVLRNGRCPTYSATCHSAYMRAARSFIENTK